MARPFLLVKTNVARPPVSPVGLEYVGEALVAQGVSWIYLCDSEFNVTKNMLAFP